MVLNYWKLNICNIICIICLKLIFNHLMNVEHCIGIKKKYLSKRQMKFAAIQTMYAANTAHNTLMRLMRNIRETCHIVWTRNKQSTCRKITRITTALHRFNDGIWDDPCENDVKLSLKWLVIYEYVLVYIYNFIMIYHEINLSRQISSALKKKCRFKTKIHWHDNAQRHIICNEIRYKRKFDLNQFLNHLIRKSFSKLTKRSSSNCWSNWECRSQIRKKYNYHNEE